MFQLANMADKAAIEAVPLSQRYDMNCTWDVFKNSAAKFGDRPAVSFQLKGDANAHSVTLTYQQLLVEITRAANAFHAAGVQPGQPVALLLPNSMDTVIATFAAQVIGISAPINPLLEPEQIAAILRESGATVLVTLAPFPKTDIADRAAKALALAPNIETVMEVDLNQWLTPPLKWIVPLIRPKRLGGHKAKIVSFAKARAAQPGDRLIFTRHATREDIGAYFHTGGTTGMPKIAEHHFGGMIFNGWMLQSIVFSEKDVILCCLPLFHVFAAYVMGMGPAIAGAHVVYISPAGFRGEGVMDNFWKLCERWKASFFTAVPTAFAALAQRPVNADVSSLRYALCGSAPMPRELFRQFEEMSGLRILEGYGMTESTCVASCNPPDGQRIIGSVGYPIPYGDMAIAHFDAEGNFRRWCDTDEVGEILISGPHVFAGYKGRPRDKAVFHENWLRTGDLGRKDGAGYFWITGRAKDLIIRGGHNIDPAFIEEALIKHPAVAFVGAIGQPDAYAGELPCAYVELKAGATATAEELVAFAAEHVVEAAARPKYVEIMKELPKTAVGKIFKPALRQAAVVRVYGAALKEAGIEASLTAIDDKKLGITAVVTSAADDATINAVLGRFPCAWKRA